MTIFVRFALFTVTLMGLAPCLSLSAEAAESAPGEPLLQYVTPDSAILLVAKPKSLIEDTEQAILGDVAYLGQFPIPPSQIEHVATMAGSSADGPFLTLAFRFTRPFSPVTVGAWLSPQAEKVEGAAIPLYMTPESDEPPAFQPGNLMSASVGFAMPDSRTAIVSFSRQHLRRLVQRIVRREDTATGDLVTQSRRLEPGSNFALLVNAQYLLAGATPETIPLMLMPGAREYPLELSTASLEATFGQRKNQMQLRLTCRDNPQDYQRVKEFAGNAGDWFINLVKFVMPLIKSRLSIGSTEKVDQLVSQLTAVVAQMEPVEPPKMDNDGYRDVLLRLKQAPSFSRALMQVSNVLVVAVNETREAARNTVQTNNFKQVMLAWLNHADRHRTFPGDIYNDQGKPLLSWRVRILPYLDQGELFNQFHLNEPWDSPHNKKLLAQIPFVYQDPHKTIPPATTRLLAASGARTPVGKPLRSITDGLSNTAAVVHAAQPVEWTRPADFDVPAKWDKETRPGFAAKLHSVQKRSVVAMCDGSVHSISNADDQELLKLFTVDDAGVVQDSVFAVSAMPSPFKPGKLEEVYESYRKESLDVDSLLADLDSGDSQKILEAGSTLLESSDRWLKRRPRPIHELQLALQIYSDVYGELPADIQDEDGKTLLSWRVQILPYLSGPEGEKLYDKIRKDEPWDSEHNRSLIAQMPAAFAAEGEKLAAGQTRIKRVTGEGVLGGGSRLRDARDGLSNTGLLVEARDAITWTQPGDVALSADLGKLLHENNGQFVIGMADGSVVVHPKETSGETWRNIFLHSDGKTFDHQTKPVPVRYDINEPLLAAVMKLLKSPVAYHRAWSQGLLELPGAWDQMLKEAAASERSALHQMLHDPDVMVRQKTLKALMDEPHAATAHIAATAPAGLDIPLVQWLSDAPDKVLTAVITQLASSEQTHLKHRAEQLQKVLQDRRKLLAEQRTPAEEEQFQQQVAQSRLLLQQGQQLLRENKIDDAMKKMDEMLAIERKIYGDTHDEVLASLKYLTQLNSQLKRPQQVIQFSKLRVSCLTKKHGADHHITLNAKADLQAAETLAALTPEQQQEDLDINKLYAELNRLTQANEGAKALELARQVVDRRRKLFGKDSVLLLGPLRILRGLTFRAKQYQQLVSVAEETARITTSLVGESSPLGLDDLSELAYCKIQAGQQEEGLKLLQRLQKISHPPASRALMARDARYTAQQLAARDKLSEAGALLMKSLKLYDEIGEQSNAANVCWHISAYSNETAAFSWRIESLWRYQLENPLQGYLNNYPRLAEQLRRKGEHHLELVLRKTLVDVVQNAVENKQTGLLPLARALTHLASCYIRIGDYEAADLTLARCTKITGNFRGDVFVFDYLSALAKVAEHRGDVAAAGKFLQEALQVSRQDKPGFLAYQARARRELAALLVTTGNPNGALQLLAAPAAVTQAAPLAERVRMLHTKASAQLQAGSRDEAKATAEAAAKMLAAIKLPVNLSAVLLLDQANLWLRLDEAEQAKTAAVAARNNAAQAFGADSLNYSQSLAILARVQWKLGDAKAASQTALESLQGAGRVVETSAYVLSPRQQLGFSQLMRNSLDLYLSIAADDPAEADRCFAAIFRWKGAGMVRQRALHQLAEQEGVAPFYQQVTAVTQQLATSVRRAKPAIQDRDPRSRSQAENLQRQDELVASLSYLRDLQQAQLSSSRLAYMDLPQAETAPAFIAALPKGSVFVDYFVVHAQGAGQPATPQDAEPFVLACVVSKTGKITTHRLGSATKTGADIAMWRSTFGASADSKAAGKRLRESLWTPLMQHLKEAETILISPDDVLGQLPFNALPGKEDDTYLIEDHRLAIVAVPQLLPQLLKRNQPAKAKAGDLLLIGDVDYNLTAAEQPQPGAAAGPGSELRAIRQGSQFAPLPGTRDEVNVIEQLFAAQQPAARLQKLTSKQASETAFRQAASTAGLVHVATHGFFAPPPARNATSGVQAFHPGLLSGLALAGANKPALTAQDDGVLTAAEIATLNMEGVQLAVLSACETGLGQVAGGEGLLGIQRSFQVAGAGATVASLWQVPDQATRVLMELFYRNYWGKKMSRLDALREAQIFLLRTPAAIENPELVRGDLRLGAPAAQQKGTRLMPRSWAAFTLSGDWR